ncbi:MAG: DNA (cytosine-5-)-methyltransferase [Chloroflexi bacterium]|nr:DNA (cytosine-5-)-methyltransferase [Chloroflexota bacterium]MBI5703730.1 DNA (cytosine-5-)-methyltransferase [Chloroflexota bacterium]
MTYRLGELFCGPGGIALGARNAKACLNGTAYTITHAWATDYDPDSCNTYRKNICPENPNSVICHDIRTLDYEMLAAISEIDGLAFGFPCNDFSAIGEQKGIHGNFGPLFSYGVKALKMFRPKWFFAENVGGLRNANDGKAFDIILNSFRDAGYKIVPHLYKFEKYGVPQARHRIIIIGIREDIPQEFRVPSPEPYANIDVSSRNAIENPPIPDNAPNHEFTKQSKTVIERLQHIKPGENAFNANLPDHLKLNVKGAKISQIYKRLDPDKPSYTVTGSGGGGTHVYHWAENRALTNRERARLQTFPDDFIFCGSKESVRKQIGMAVPPKGAEIVFNALLASLLGIDYPFISPNIVAIENLFEQTHYIVNEKNGEY